MNSEKEISEILNLIGYGLAKFDIDFANEFGFKNKTSFFKYIVDLGLVKTSKAVSNRQDSFDPYFDNGRKGWWQRKQREHIKLFIDSLFGQEDVQNFANIVKFYLKDFNNQIDINIPKITPVTNSKIKQMKETGNEAEFYFMQNYTILEQFEAGSLEDARLWSDGYDFQIKVNQDFLLAEVKGVSQKQGSIRMTEREYQKAQEFSDKYFLIIVSNLMNTPKMTILKNPITKIKLEAKTINPKPRIEYHTSNIKW